MTNSPTDWTSAQAQIARAVVMKLGIDLNAGDRVALQRPLLTKTDAWSHYLLGRPQFEKASDRGDLNAIQEYQAAITEDPGFAEAYVGLLKLILTWAINSRSQRPISSSPMPAFGQL